MNSIYRLVNGRKLTSKSVKTFGYSQLKIQFEDHVFKKFCSNGTMKMGIGLAYLKHFMGQVLVPQRIPATKSVSHHFMY